MEALTQPALLLLAGLLGSVALEWFSHRIRMPSRPLHFLLWLVVIPLALVAYPRSQAAGLVLHERLSVPLLLLALAALGAVLLSRVLNGVTDYYLRDLEAYWRRAPEQHPRWQQRVRMLRQVSGVVAGIVAVILAALIYLQQVGVDLSALVAGAGLISVGVSWFARDILADWIAGINIVVEDQFGVGDVIDTGTYVGTVEQFNLRVTRLRDIEGNAVTVANGLLRAVKNESSLWSQVDLSVRVEHGTDVRKALALMQDLASTLKAEWPERVLDDPRMLGVEDLSAEGVRLRMLVRTAPLEQWKVRRELLQRVQEAFTRSGVVLS